ncbi:MAG: choice-of-anchor D domain-containing protein [Bacteroidia bacterium]|nr:choice-of-anchor D domain-containing protein [Bacteroidia bacterium]
MITRRMGLLATLLVLAPYMAAYGQWISDAASNNAICREGNYQRSPRLVSDGKGGAIICWADERAAAGVIKVYAQRIDKDGIVRWPVNGVVISPALSKQLKPEIIADGAGGAIIVWTDTRNINTDIFAQRIDSSGNVLWTAEGVPVATGSSEQMDPQLASDGQQGAIVTWSAHTNTAQDGHIFAQRIDSNGNQLWSPELTLSFSDQFESRPSIASDGNGGAYIAWVFYNNAAYDVYMQRVTSGGAQMWTNGGVGIAIDGGPQDSPMLVADGTGKAFLAYYDWNSGSRPTLHVAVVNPDSTKAASLRVTSSSGGQTNPQLSNIGPGLLGIAWEDGRVSGKTRAYAQIIDNTGKKSWAADGVAVTNRAGSHATPFVIPDGNGGIIVSWEDQTTSIIESDIFAQRISSAGALLWSNAGVAVGTAGRMQTYPWMCSDGAGGAIIAWEDYRLSFSNPDIYASRILADGSFPLEAPTLALSSRMVDFGTVSVGFSSTRNITLTNTGDLPLNIASITSSHPQFTMTPDNTTIPPNGDVEAVLRFVPTSKGTLNGAIVVESNSIHSPDTIFVTGKATATPAIEVDKRSWNFGSVPIGTRKSTVLNISNPGNDTLVISSITASNPVFTVAIASHVLLPGAAFSDTVYFSPTVPGPASGELTVTSNAPTSPTLVSLSGTGSEATVVTLTIDPGAITFGDVDLGSHRDTTVTITNTGNDTLRISAFTCSDSRFTLESPLAHIAPSATRDFTLRFTPDMIGPVSSVFIVTSNAVSAADSIVVQGTGKEVVSVRPTHELPGAFALHPNVPNPFTSVTSIPYELGIFAPVRLTVHDALGRVTAVLVDEAKGPGVYSAQWSPAQAVPGVYFLVLRVGTEVRCQRMLYMR